MERLRSPLPLRAIAVVVRDDWRVRRRLSKQPSRVQLAGVQLELEDWWATPPIRQAIYEGWYESEERQILDSTLRPEDRYVELGGGIGFIASRACQIVGDDQVTVFEPDARLAAVAAATARRNGFAPTIRSELLAASDGETEFFLHRDFWSSSVSAVAGATPVRVATRSLAGELERLAPTYLMVDVEGAETELLGSGELPDSVRALCVELHPALAGADAVQRLLVKLMQSGFALDLGLSTRWVAFLSRRAEPVR